MSEMIERVEAAILAKIEERYHVLLFNGLGDIGRVAIEAMRKPTQTMVDSCGNGECAKWAPGAWANYIDAALSSAKQKAE